MIAALFLSALAFGGKDVREGAGVGISGGLSPVEPAFFGTPRPYPSFAAHSMMMMVRGGSSRRGRRGRLRRTPSHQRIGAVFEVGTSPTLQGIDDSNRAHGGGGLLVGGQWGLGDLYLTTSVGVGLGVYHQWLTTPGREHAVTTTGPWLRPRLAIGIPLGKESQLEVGPSLSTVIPMHTSHKNGRPQGHYLGQASLDVTLILGSVGPTPR